MNLCDQDKDTYEVFMGQTLEAVVNASDNFQVHDFVLRHSVLCVIKICSCCSAFQYSPLDTKSYSYIDTSQDSIDFVKISKIKINTGDDLRASVTFVYENVDKAYKDVTLSKMPKFVV